MDTLKMTFSKLTAAGNDFICVDNTTGQYNDLLNSDALSTFVQHVCDRALGAGADGIIFAGMLGSGAGVDICARFFEPDGSEARLCGNGTACFSQWVVRKGLLEGPEVTILTAAGTARCKGLDDAAGRPVVCIPDPENLRQDLHVVTGDRSYNLHYVVVGVPHGVVFLKDEPLDTFDVYARGKELREHPCFAPEGINVNFVRVLQEGEIAVRTFEFGVENETLACGTGSSAAACLAILTHDWAPAYTSGEKPVNVWVRGGELLRVWADVGQSGLITDVCLETPVQPVYEGTFDRSFLQRLTPAHTLSHCNCAGLV